MIKTYSLPCSDNRFIRRMACSLLYDCKIRYQKQKYVFKDGAKYVLFEHLIL